MSWGWIKPKLAAETVIHLFYLFHCSVALQWQAVVKKPVLQKKGLPKATLVAFKSATCWMGSETPVYHDGALQNVKLCLCSKFGNDSSTARWAGVKIPKKSLFLIRSRVACSKGREAVWCALHGHPLCSCIALTSTQNGWCLRARKMKNKNWKFRAVKG